MPLLPPHSSRSGGISKYRVRPVDEFLYVAVMYLVGLRDDKGKFLGTEVVLHPLGDGLSRPVLNTHTTRHMTRQFLVDIRAKHLVGQGI